MNDQLSTHPLFANSGPVQSDQKPKQLSTDEHVIRKVLAECIRLNKLGQLKSVLDSKLESTLRVAEPISFVEQLRRLKAETDSKGEQNERQ